MGRRRSTWAWLLGMGALMLVCEYGIGDETDSLVQEGEKVQ
jgi:hypothetical protein